MNSCQHSLRLILMTLIIGYKIQRTWGAEKGSSSNDTTELLATLLSTLSPEVTQTILNSASKTVIEKSDSTAEDRISWWNSLNTAIDDFIREFGWQHKASVTRVDRRLKTPEWPITSDDGFSKRFRLNFSYQIQDQDEVHSSIIVMMPELGYLHEKVKELMVYDKEKYMFEKVLPLMYQSWPSEKHSPNFYASAEFGTLLVENFNDGSYIRKTDMLNSVDECKLVFKALAQFHALSVTQLDQVTYANLDSLTPVDVLVSNAVTGHTSMEMLTHYSERMSKFLPPSMRNEVRNMTRNLGSVVKSTYTASRGVDEFAVVLQGNMTRENVFFILDKETSRITGCKFFDFRTSHVGSPVLDLMVYLLSGVEFEVFRDEGDSLFEFYLEELRKSLAMFDSSCEYNLTMLRSDLKFYKAYFIYMLVSSVSLQWESNDDPGPIKVDQLVKNRLDALKSESFKSFFRKWMNTFAKW